jgi:tetratricopeptide (TPR) repeat protein
MKITARILFILLLADFVTSSAHADLTKGIEDFEKHRWAASMGEFIDVLQHDPRNVQAHEYLALAAHELEAERAAVTRDKRLEMLSNASQLMEDNHQDSNPLQSAINETKTAEDKARADRAHTQCVMAEMEDRRGDLAAANDYVLRVLQDDPANAEAQRKLSDLQSELRQTLTTGSLTEAQRALFEGFYAFGQSDYRSAALAWAKARAALSDNSPDTNAQAHYEAGLIAYAGGHEDEAVREWHIALRLDPDNEKSQLALNKLHRENKLSEELP